MLLARIEENSGGGGGIGGEGRELAAGVDFTGLERLQR